MAYSITYGEGKMKRKQINPLHFPHNKKVMAAAAVCLLLVGVFAFAGIENIKSFLLPGDPEVTEAAFGGMVEDLRAGESLTDAITTFCREILDGAGFYE